MSDTPKFEVIDRRKFKAEEEEQESRAAEKAAETAPASQTPAAATPVAAPSGGPRLVVNESKATTAAEEADDADAEQEGAGEFPPAPTASESQKQKTAYEGASQRLEDLIRAQNPAMGPQPVVNFEQLVQQFYVSAMIQMGAGTQDGQRPRVDILGARTTIDLLGILAEKTKGNLTENEDRMLHTVLYECRMAFMELTSMISLQGMQPPQPPPPGKR